MHRLEPGLETHRARRGDRLIPRRRERYTIRERMSPVIKTCALTAVSVISREYRRHLHIRRCEVDRPDIIRLHVIEPVIGRHDRGCHNSRHHRIRDPKNREITQHRGIHCQTKLVTRGVLRAIGNIHRSSLGLVGHQGRRVCGGYTIRKGDRDRIGHDVIGNDDPFDRRLSPIGSIARAPESQILRAIK